VWSGLGASRGVAGTTTATRLPSGATSKPTADCFKLPGYLHPVMTRNVCPSAFGASTMTNFV
jgi:hypothetical protein